MLMASLSSTAQEENPQPPPSDGDQAGVLDAREKVTLLAVSLWIFLQVPVALLMRMWANERGANGNLWLVLGTIPVLGYLSWAFYLWTRSHHPRPAVVEGPHIPRSQERSRT
jgi:hypothetical protein